MTPTVHHRISVSGISSWNQPLDDDLRMYEALGVHSVGVALRKLASDADVELITQSGLHVANVIGVGHTGLDEAIRIAQRLGSAPVVFTTGPAGGLDWDEAADQLAAALAPVLPAPVTLCLEHTNSLRTDVSFVHTLRDALDLADRLGVSVCMEVNACWAERDLAATVASRVQRIGLVQVSDTAVGTLSTPNRLVPGDGDIPLTRILRQLLGAGYTGMFDLELIGPRIEEEGYGRAIERSCAYLTTVLTELQKSLP